MFQMYAYNVLNGVKLCSLTINVWIWIYILLDGSIIHHIYFIFMIFYDRHFKYVWLINIRFVFSKDLIT